MVAVVARLLLRRLGRHLAQPPDHDGAVWAAAFFIPVFIGLRATLLLRRGLRSRLLGRRILRGRLLGRRRRLRLLVGLRRGLVGTAAAFRRRGRGTSVAVPTGAGRAGAAPVLGRLHAGGTGGRESNLMAGLIGWPRAAGGGWPRRCRPGRRVGNGGAVAERARRGCVRRQLHHHRVFVALEDLETHFAGATERKFRRCGRAREGVVARHLRDRHDLGAGDPGQIVDDRHRIVVQDRPGIENVEIEAAIRARLAGLRAALGDLEREWIEPCLCTAEVLTRIRLIDCKSCFRVPLD